MPLHLPQPAIVRGAENLTVLIQTNVPVQMSAMDAKLSGKTTTIVKKRIGEHLGDARRYTPPPAKQTGSRLSQHIGNLFFHNIPHSLNWSIIAQKQPFNPVANFCMLCNVEKVLILYHPELSTLNLRNELYGWCHHKERMLLLNTCYVV